LKSSKILENLEQMEASLTSRKWTNGHRVMNKIASQIPGKNTSGCLPSSCDVE
jgi:hypothetical protein